DADLRGMVVLRSLGFQLVPFKLHRFRKQRRFADEIDHLDAAKPARHLTFVDHDPAGSTDNPSSWSVHWHPCSPRRGCISKVIDPVQHQAAGGDGLILQGVCKRIPLVAHTASVTHNIFCIRPHSQRQTMTLHRTGSRSG
ncbi:hypothetical protein, partial [Aeromonas salmonicida]